MRAAAPNVAYPLAFYRNGLATFLGQFRLTTGDGRQVLAGELDRPVDLPVEDARQGRETSSEIYFLIDLVNSNCRCQSASVGFYHSDSH